MSKTKSPRRGARAEPRIRVLLIESDTAVRVGSAEGPLTTLEAAAGGIRADARAVGPVWRLEGDLLRVGGLRVRGDLEVRRVSSGLQVVNRVPLEDYVAGTVGREIYPSWQEETLKAQAVVARTYALHERTRNRRAGHDVESTVISQRFLEGRVAPSIAAAVEEGRTAFANLRKATFFLVSSGAAEVLAILAAMVVRLPLPFLPAQVLWLNVVTNGIQHVGLAFEPHTALLLSPQLTVRKEFLVGRPVGGVVEIGAAFANLAAR